MNRTSGSNRWKRRFIKIFEVSCVFGIVGVSSLESESGEFVFTNVRFREIGCD